MSTYDKPLQTENVEDNQAENHDLDDDDLPHVSELGTKSQLANFFTKYASHNKISDRCYLDGRYFWKVLAPYMGLVGSEMYVRMNLGKLTEDPNDGTMREFEILPVAFDLEELSMTNGSPTRYRLIKLIIDISTDAASNQGSVHSNLIYIDTKNKTITRFEPMLDPQYTQPLNEYLQNTWKDILPGYAYMMLNEHPQLPVTDTCPSKGMCAAYTLKKAMMLVTGNDKPMNGPPDLEEKKIMKFADAIETEYGFIPGEAEIEAGLSIAYSPGGYYPGPAGPVYPGLAWGPSYYGYVWGPRFGRRRGWGWGFGPHRHRRFYGSPEYGWWAHRVDSNTGRRETGCSACSGKTDNYSWQRQREMEGIPSYDGDWERDEMGDWKPKATALVYVGDSPKPAEATAFRGLDAPGRPSDVEDFYKSTGKPYVRSDVKKYKKEYGCSACQAKHSHDDTCGHMASPRLTPTGDEYGWRDVFKRKPKEPESKLGAPGSKNYGNPMKKPVAYCDPRRPKGTECRSENGMFDNFGQSKYNPGNWSPAGQALGGAAVGAGAGLLLGGGVKGAVIGGALGAGSGYLLGRLSRRQ